MKKNIYAYLSILISMYCDERILETVPSEPPISSHKQEIDKKFDKMLSSGIATDKMVVIPIRYILEQVKILIIEEEFVLSDKVINAFKKIYAIISLLNDVDQGKAKEMQAIIVALIDPYIKIRYLALLKSLI